MQNCGVRPENSAEPTAPNSTIKSPKAREFKLDPPAQSDFKCLRRADKC